MKHWTAKAYRKNKLVSTTLNCLPANTRAEAQVMAEAEYAADKATDENAPDYDRITVTPKGCSPERKCLPW